MIVRFFLFLISLSTTLEEKLWKWWYQKLSTSYKKQDWRFMNYGYAPTQEEDSLTLKSKEDEENRLFIQLYHRTLLGVEMEGKKVLEVGSGKGGGTDYVARYFSPESIIGIDFAKSAVDLCNQFYHEPNLQFREGSAEQLPFEDNQFDVIFNVESSHCYGNMKAFVAEVERVLKPGGIFAWADLRPQEVMTKEEILFKDSSLKVLAKENITANVLQALSKISSRKKETIEKLVPRFWQPLFYEFTGVRDSKIYKGFKEGRMVYWCYRFQKSNQG
jgi:ubiquinone/menaquinone biosynthesis C-methylase UbiE